MQYAYALSEIYRHYPVVYHIGVHYSEVLTFGLFRIAIALIKTVVPPVFEIAVLAFHVKPDGKYRSYGIRLSKTLILVEFGA